MGLSILSNALFALVFSGLYDIANGFYIPGVYPLKLNQGDSVILKVNSLTSLHTHVPKEYYHLPFCLPPGGPMMAAQNLGEFLTGNKIQSSPYNLNMLIETYCAKLCQITLSKTQAAKLKQHIKHGYHHNWIVDNLPSAAVGLNPRGEKQRHYAGGFPIGFVAIDTREAFIYNHVNIILDYHRPIPDENAYHIVGFSVEPISIHHEFPNGYQWDGIKVEGYVKELSTCSSDSHMERDMVRKNQMVQEGQPIIYTYDVIWRESEIKWASRWDIYLSEDHLVPAKVHWYSIANSIIVVLFLSIFITVILIRNLKRDKAISISVGDNVEVDKTGWKSLHADVFRPPLQRPMLFAVFIGTGVQLFFTIIMVLVVAMSGSISAARRGSFILNLLFFFMIGGYIGGYVSLRIYKSIGGSNERLCTILMATLFSGLAFAMFLFFNIFFFFLESTGSVPILDVIIVAGMWCISMGLVYWGARHGCKKAKTIDYPTATTGSIPRPIPKPTSICCHPMFAIVGSGLTSFAVIYVEFFFIMTSLWMDQFYFTFGFALIVFCLMCITCAEATVLSVYYQLRSENHRWWWFSFFASGSVGFLTFGYCVVWYQSLEATNEMMMMPHLLYFGYMSLFCFGMFLVAGSVGTLSSWWFVKMIYSSATDVPDEVSNESATEETKLTEEANVDDE